MFVCCDAVAGLREEEQKSDEGADKKQKKKKKQEDKLMMTKRPLSCKWADDCVFQSTKAMIDSLLVRAVIPKLQHGAVTLVSTGGGCFAFAVTEVCKLWGVRTYMATTDRKLAVDVATEYTFDDNIKQMVSKFTKCDILLFHCHFRNA